jgi:hypothetical protein
MATVEDELHAFMICVGSEPLTRRRVLFLCDVGRVHAPILNLLSSPAEFMARMITSLDTIELCAKYVCVRCAGDIYLCTNSGP